jgi:hypothetical protein
VTDAGLAEYLTEWRKTNAHDPRRAMMQEAPE